MRSLWVARLVFCVALLTRERSEAQDQFNCNTLQFQEDAQAVYGGDADEKLLRALEETPYTKRGVHLEHITNALSTWDGEG